MFTLSYKTSDGVHPARYIVPVIALCLMVAAGSGNILIDSAFAQAQTQWSELPPIDSFATPAVSSYSDSRLYVAAVAFNGLVHYTSTASPGGWSAWSLIGPQPSSGFFNPAFYADTGTAPVLIRDDTVLYLFVRGKDNNFYETHKQGIASWTDWQKLTTDGHFEGRFSVALTKPDNSLHVLYARTNQTVEYRRFLIKPGTTPWYQSGSVEQWSNAVEGTVGTDGTSQLVAVIRKNDRQLLVQRKVSPWIASWKPIGTLSAGSQGNFYDISDVVYGTGAFHVAYAINHIVDDIAQTYAYEIQHIRIRPGEADTQSIRSVANYNPFVTEPDGTLISITQPQIALSLYRNKLVLSYKDPMGFVRISRWDSADPTAPWVGNAISDAGHRTDHRPALGTLNRRPSLSVADYGSSNFGNDLFAAITEKGTDSILFTNFSRAALSKDVDTQFSVYNSNSDGQPVVCRNQNEPLAPSLIGDIGQDGRPFFTELGYVLWTMPNWLIGNNYKTAGTLGCQAGNTSGRFDPNPTCNETKYPVIIISQGGSGICNGVWVYRGDTYSGNIFHELMHSFSGGTLGLSDNNNEPPTTTNESRSGIPLSALTSAFTIFGSRVNGDCFGGPGSNTCPNTRPAGFTGDAGNYDVTTRQHSFIGALTRYFADGDQLRLWIQQDLQQGDTLLQSKYNWFRQYIFKGVEFRKDNDLLTARLAVPASQQVFFHSAVTNPEKTSNPSQAKPIAIGSLADGGNLLSVELGTLEFENPVDVYLALYVPALDPFNLYLISDLGITPLSAGLTPLKATTTGPINMALFGDIPTVLLPKTTYYLGLYVSPAGNLGKNYFWITSFTIQ